jgi:tetratricopeptide (TPR) repeat protein
MMNHVGDVSSTAVLLSDLGLVAKETSEFDQAFRYYEESLRLMRRVDNKAGQADVYAMLARLYMVQQLYEQAKACTQTSLAIAERLHDELRMGGAWYVLANCYEEQGHLKEAEGFLQRVVRIDKKYQLPKLQENSNRLESLRQRLRNGGSEINDPDLLR